MNESGTDRKTLLIGIGNSGRSDDALGWKFMDEFGEYDHLFDFEYRYQLQIEDAELVSRYQKVIFVDASYMFLDNGFSFERCTPAPLTSFTSHELSPECIIWLAQDLYNASPEAFVLAIRGTEWGLHLGLSPDAHENFSRAAEFFRDYLLTPAIPGEAH
jgi:hydrogenase maturation protease